jgi:hypothetical protein
MPNKEVDPVASWLRSQGVNELTVARLQRAAKARGIDNEAFLHELMDHWTSAPEARKESPARSGALQSALFAPHVEPQRYAA